MSEIANSPLGKTSSYITNYSPSLLFPIPRSGKRAEIGVKNNALPFLGVDIWNAYEISWLNDKGLPQAAIGEFTFPAISPNIIESKSFKLYLNSFNQSVFSSLEEVKLTLEKDLTFAAEATVGVNLFKISDITNITVTDFKGTCLDDLDIKVDTYDYDASFLKTESGVTEEALVSHLLKSNCLVTGQPDWASISIQYKGAKINHEGLLKYLVSFRNHHEFHEQCVERVFVDISRQCKPQELTVYARYTRRGGLDINPFRSSTNRYPDNIRNSRQ